MTTIMLATLVQELGSTQGLILLIIWILLIGCVLWAVRWALSQSGLPAPVQTVTLVVIALVILLVVLTRFGVV
jgi:hypothetical protein